MRKHRSGMVTFALIRRGRTFSVTVTVTMQVSPGAEGTVITHAYCERTLRLRGWNVALKHAVDWAGSGAIARSARCFARAVEMDASAAAGCTATATDPMIRQVVKRFMRSILWAHRGADPVV